MSLKRYQNELIVLLSILIMVGMFLYKENQINLYRVESEQTQQELSQLEELISLKKVWGDKKISKKLEKIQTLLPPSKVKWSKKGKKVTASFSELTPNELNKVITKILNIAVVIQKLEIYKRDKTYDMGFKCKW